MGCGLECSVLYCLEVSKCLIQKRGQQFSANHLLEANILHLKIEYLRIIGGLKKRLIFIDYIFSIFFKQRGTNNFVHMGNLSQKKLRLLVTPTLLQQPLQ